MYVTCFTETYWAYYNNCYDAGFREILEQG